jgi:hypothetical protein
MVIAHLSESLYEKTVDYSMWQSKTTIPWQKRLRNLSGLMSYSLLTQTNNMYRLCLEVDTQETEPLYSVTNVS